MIARLVTCLIALALLPLGAALAQDAPIDPDSVTYDEVNDVARKLYCPVCPNELLVDCQTQACVQWREEIRLQLADGQSEQQVVDSFVRRYGERVVPIPQDPFLRGLSLLTPFVLAGVALMAALATYARWLRRRPAESAAAPAPSAGSADAPDDGYRARFERDLNA